MIVRKANVKDLNYCVEEGCKFLKTRWPNKKIDKANVYIKLYYLIHSGILLVADDKGELKGMIGGLVTINIWYGDEIDATELFWWVPEEHRNSRAGVLLLKGFIGAAKEKKATTIVLSLLTKSPISDNALIKRGFKLEEKAFIMEV